MSTIRQLLQKGKNGLASEDISTPELDSEVLLARAMLKSREFIHTYPREPVSPEEAKEFFQLLKRRRQGEPLAYIVGFKDFYGMRFAVNKNVLVPRPETETLVREVLVSTPRERSFNVWDIGTGSCCIGVALAKILEKEDNFKKVYAIDISKKALKVAQKNRSQHRAEKKIELIHSDLLSSVLKNKGKYKMAFRDFNIVAANLPYLTEENFRHSPTIQKEPPKALVAPEKGLYYYRRLLEQISEIESSFLVIIEIDPEQVTLLKEMVASILPQAKLEVKTDLSGRDRVAKITIF